MPYEGKHWTSSNQAPAYVEKSNDTGDNHPDEAFIYPGHGLEPENSSDPSKMIFLPLPVGDERKYMHELLGQSQIEFNANVIIPKGIIVVAKSHSGDARWISEVRKDFTHLFNRKNSEYFLDPIKHISKINDMLGNVAIYREGDSCPNFFNSRILNKNPIDWLSYDNSISTPIGTIKIPFPHNLTDDFLLEQTNLPPEKELKWGGRYTTMLEIANKLNSDIYPLEKLFNNYFKICKDAEGTFSKFKNYIEEYIKKNPDTLFSDFLNASILSTNLKNEINTIKLKGPTKPKVLYFLTCRSRYVKEWISEENRLGTTNLNSIIVSSNKLTHKPIESNHIAGIKFGPASPVQPKTINLSNAMINQVENTIIKRNKNERNKLRKRVSSLPNTIRTQISEALLQRRLSGKAYIEKNAEQYQLREAEAPIESQLLRAKELAAAEAIVAARWKLKDEQKKAEIEAAEEARLAARAAKKELNARRQFAIKAGYSKFDDGWRQIFPDPYNKNPRTFINVPTREEIQEEINKLSALREAARVRSQAERNSALEAAEEATAVAAGWYEDMQTLGPEGKPIWRHKDPGSRTYWYVPTSAQIEEERHRRENTITGFHIRRGLRKFGWNKTANFLDRHIGSKKRTRKNRRNKSGF